MARIEIVADFFGCEYGDRMRDEMRVERFAQAVAIPFASQIDMRDLTVTVLIPEIVPSKRRHEILHNQRGELLEAALKRRADVVIATLPFHLHD